MADHTNPKGASSDRQISTEDMMGEMAKVLAQQEQDLLKSRQALAFWTTMCSVMLVKMGATTPDTQIVVTPADINGVDGSELGYTNNNRGEKTRHNFYIKLAGTGERVTGEELRNAGKNKGDSGPRIIGLNGKPIT